MSSRTVIEINHDYLNKLRNGDSFMWYRLLLGLISCDIDQGEKEFLASRGLRILDADSHPCVRSLIGAPKEHPRRAAGGNARALSLSAQRRKEIASLTPRSFALSEDPPTLTVAAACSKHRRTDVLPMHPQLVSLSVKSSLAPSGPWSVRGPRR